MSIYTTKVSVLRGPLSAFTLYDLQNQRSSGGPAKGWSIVYRAITSVFVGFLTILPLLFVGLLCTLFAGAVFGSFSNQAAIIIGGMFQALCAAVLWCVFRRVYIRRVPYARGFDSVAQLQSLLLRHLLEVIPDDATVDLSYIPNTRPTSFADESVLKRRASFGWVVNATFDTIPITLSLRENDEGAWVMDVETQDEFPSELRIFLENASVRGLCTFSEDGRCARFHEGEHAFSTRIWEEDTQQILLRGRTWINPLVRMLSAYTQGFEGIDIPMQSTFSGQSETAPHVLEEHAKQSWSYTQTREEARGVAKAWREVKSSRAKESYAWGFLWVLFAGLLGLLLVTGLFWLISIGDEPSDVFSSLFMFCVVVLSAQSLGNVLMWDTRASMSYPDVWMTQVSLKREIMRTETELRVDDVVVHLDVPFQVSYTRSPKIEGERELLGVVVSQTREGATVRAKFRVPIEDSPWFSSLPVLVSSGFVVDPKAFDVWIQPALAYYRSMHVHDLHSAAHERVSVSV